MRRFTFAAVAKLVRTFHQIRTRPQRRGYVFVGSLLHTLGKTGFAFSLTMGLRELDLGVPGLICWPLLERRRSLRVRTEPAGC